MLLPAHHHRQAQVANHNAQIQAMVTEIGRRINRDQRNGHRSTIEYVFGPQHVADEIAGKVRASGYRVEVRTRGTEHLFTITLG